MWLERMDWAGTELYIHEYINIRTSDIQKRLCKNVHKENVADDKKWHRGEHFKPAERLIDA